MLLLKLKKNHPDLVVLPERLHQKSTSTITQTIQRYVEQQSLYQQPALLILTQYNSQIQSASYKDFKRFETLQKPVNQIKMLQKCQDIFSSTDLASDLMISTTCSSKEIDSIFLSCSSSE